MLAEKEILTPNPFACLINYMSDASKSQQFRRLLLERLDKRELMAADAAFMFTDAPDEFLFGDQPNTTLEFLNPLNDAADIGDANFVNVSLPCADADGHAGPAIVPSSSTGFDTLMLGTSNAGADSMSSLSSLQHSRPVFEIHKGVVTSDNSQAKFHGSIAPPAVWFEPPGEAAGFSGKFSHETFATDPVNANAQNLEAGDLVRVAVVAENVGSGRSSAFDLTLQDSLPAGLKIPEKGLNFSVLDGHGKPLEFAPGDTNEKTASFFQSGIRILSPVNGLLADDGSNFVVISYDLEVEDDAGIGQVTESSAAITSYSVQPGGPDYSSATTADAATFAVKLPTVVHELVGTSHDFTAGRDIAIGESANYRVSIDLPEANTSDATLKITLPRGMAIQNLLSISWSEGVAVSNSAEQILAGAQVLDHGNGIRNEGRVLLLDLGDIKNLNRDDSSPERIEVHYAAIVTNDIQNNEGDQRRPEATFTYSEGASSSKSDQVRIADAQLAISREFSATQADAGDVVTVRLDIQHVGNRTDAFDLLLEERIPEQWEILPDSLEIHGHDGSLTFENGKLNATLGHLPKDTNFTIRYAFRLADDVHAGSILAADASLSWTSLPGTPGELNVNNRLGVERTGDSLNPGENANYYSTQNTGELHIHTPQIQSTFRETSAAQTNSTDLTIGEYATFVIDITVPEGVHELQLGIFESLSSLEYEIVDLKLVHAGENLSGGILNQISYADSWQLTPTNSLRVGTISNTPDNIESSADNLSFEVSVKTLDHVSNVEGRSTEFGISVDFVHGQVSARDIVRLAEPGVITNVQYERGVDAGDVVNVRLTLAHNPRYGSDPQNVSFTGYSGADALEIVAGSLELSHGSILSGNSEGNKAAKVYVPSLSPGESAELLLQIRIAENALPGEQLDLLGITEWQSLEDGSGREYASPQNTTFEVNASKISGWAFVDENQDGVQDANEIGLIGSQVTLEGIDHLGHPVLERTQVDPGGYYQFGHLRPGNYSLHHEQLTTFADGPDYAGSLGGNTQNDKISDIILPPGVASEGSDYNFTETSLSWISGTVYVDHSQDGRLGSDEKGVPEVTVILKGLTEDGLEVERQTQTNSRGYFVFGSLPAGTYALHQEQPEGYFDTTEQIGTVGGQLGQDQISEIKIQAGRPGEFYNFGEYEPSALEGQLYIDYDRDLVRDRLDGLLGGLDVLLTGVNDLGESVEQSTKSELDGSYRFENLRPGEYRISSVSVQGLDRGESNVGIFRGGANPHSHNGLAIAYGFESILLPEGTRGEAYDIGYFDPNHTESVLAEEFDSHYVFTGTDDSDRIAVQLSSDKVTINVNNDSYAFAATEKVAFSVIGFFGDDRISINGSESKEEIDIRSDSARLKGTWFSGLFYGMEAIDFAGGGNEDIVRFYDHAGDSHLEAKPFEATWSSDGYAHHATEVHRIYAYASNGGQDTASLTGSALRDNFIATPENARLYDGDYYIWTEGFDKVNAKANDLGDRAYLYGNANSSDLLTASEHYVHLSGETYSLNAESFRYVTVNGGAGENDIANLVGTHKDDNFHSRPTVATFDADDTRIVAKGFEIIEVDAVDGNDAATLLDSHYNDLFSATAQSATLANSISTITVNGFDSVDAHALAGGDDSAIIQGGQGKDTLRAWPDRWILEGQKFNLAGYGFTQLEAKSTDIADTAYLYDSAGNDVLEMRDDFARITGERFDNSAVGFRRVVAEATNGGIDRATFQDGDSRSTIRYDGERLTAFGEGFSKNAIGFEIVDALYSELAGNDRVELGEDLILDMILEDADKVLYRVGLSKGPTGSTEAIRDRVANLFDGQ